MVWTASLEARLENPRSDLVDLADELLSALEQQPGVLGAAAFVNLEEQTLGGRFDVEQPDARAAFHAAVDYFIVALAAIGLVDTAVAIIGVEIVEAQVLPRHERERELATT